MAAPDPNIYLGGGAIAVLLTTFGLLARRFLISYDRQQASLLEPAYRELTKLRERNDHCERNLQILVDALREQGIKIPPEIWRP